MIERLRARNEWKFFGVLPKADRPLAVAWWVVLSLRGLLPALFAIAMGVLVGAVQRGDRSPRRWRWWASCSCCSRFCRRSTRRSAPTSAAGPPRGSTTELTIACVAPAGDGPPRGPAAHHRPHDGARLRPRHHRAADVHLDGLHRLRAGGDGGGLASALVLAAYAWWAPLLLAGAWLATHWLLRESAVWRDRNTEEVREAQRHADYAYRLAVDPPAAKELRLFGLAAWTVERFTSRRRRLLDLQWQATRLRERPVLWSLLLVLAANIVVFWSMASAAADGRLALGRVVTFASAAVSTSMIAFGGLSWALDGAAAPVAAVLRLQEAMGPAGALSPRHSRRRSGMPAREIRFRNVTFAYPGRRASRCSRASI